MPFLRSLSEETPPPETFPDVFHGTDEDHGGPASDDDGNKDGDREEGGGLDADTMQTLRVAFAERNERSEDVDDKAKGPGAESGRTRLNEQKPRARGRETHRNRSHGGCLQASIHDTRPASYIAR